MKVLVLGKATAESAAGELGSAEDFGALHRFNEELVAAGVVLAAAVCSRRARARAWPSTPTAVPG